MKYTKAQITFYTKKEKKDLSEKESLQLFLHLQKANKKLSAENLADAWLQSAAVSPMSADEGNKICALDQFVGASVNSELVDLNDDIEKKLSLHENTTSQDASTEKLNLEIIVFDESNEMALHFLRHSTTHVMAHAIQNLFKDVTFAIGPVTHDGFYYDIDFGDKKVTKEDFALLEAEMKKIAKTNHKNLKETISRPAALKLFNNHRYKTEIIDSLPADAEISVYHTGNFTDLCRGPHLHSTKSIKHIKLQRIAGAYWKGNEKNPMLTRVYGTAFFTKNALHDYLKNQKLAQEKDHNKLGKSLGIFHTDESVGQGLPLLTSKGTVLFNVLRKFVEELEAKHGYEHTLTPYLAKSDLYKISGHWQLYKEGMFVIDNEHGEFALRPMTCPFHFSLYNAERHSYRELPVRYAETSTLFRNEASGEMHGLIRVRQFTLADGHIICREDQIEQEFESCIDLLTTILKTIGFENYTYRLSKWDPKEKGKKYIDNPEAWEFCEDKMRKILNKRELPFVEAVGEAAFYGPKLDIQMRNVFGKEDTLLTLQIDFAMPERFDMTYIDKEDNKQRPYVLHRSSIGCYERTIALLIEHYAGKFPFWMAITQVAVLSINESTHDYAEDLYRQLCKLGIRAKLDVRGESLSKKIKQANAKKIPLLLTIGEKEKIANTISVRTYNNTVTNNIAKNDFFKTIEQMQSQKTKELLY